MRTRSPLGGAAQVLTRCGGAISVAWLRPLAVGRFVDDSSCGIRSGSNDRHLPDTDRPLSLRRQCAGMERVLNSRPDALHQRRQRGVVEPFLPDRYDRWLALAARRKHGMKIHIECNACARPGTRPPQNVCGARSTHADFGHVDHVPSRLSQQSSRGARQTLVQSEPSHMVFRGCTLSSRFRAANSSAWRIS